MIERKPSIKSIVNKDAVNIDNCEKEPIHIPGSIQEHGFLLALHTGTKVIEFASENCAVFTGLPFTDFLGSKLEKVFPAAEVVAFFQTVQAQQADDILPFVFSLKDVNYNTTFHTSGHYLVLEFEPFPDGRVILPDLYKQTKKFTSYLDSTGDLQALCQKIAEETRNITGYDRVMIYRFDEYYNGEVYAESKLENLESFLGLHYPHTDIPAQARQLYLTNLMRLIVDVTYAPVPLFALAKEKTDNSSLDLSLSTLRSVSPIHIEYLKNMGVGATLTISLILEGKLWGLIACHHYSPKNLPYYTRYAAQLQGHFLTSQIKVREVAEEYALTRILEERLHDQLEKLDDLNTFLEQIPRDRSLMALTQSTGVAVFVNDTLYTQGYVPDEQHMTPLIYWLKKTGKDRYYTTHLSADYADGPSISKDAAGILYHSMSSVNNDCIIWFKPEVVDIINWAGNPNDAIQKKENAILSPRKSFESWKEEVKHTSTKWADAKLHIASTFAYALQRLIFSTQILENENRYRLLVEKLQKAYAELSNLNWISTHDLKEPLRKIQIFASRMLNSSTLSEDTNNSYALKRMQLAASRMQQLIDDISSYSSLNETDIKIDKEDLNELVSEVLTGLQEEVENTDAVIQVEKLPAVYGVKFQLAQLFVNLLTNALKFSDGKPSIKISADAHPLILNGKSYHRISISDKGIGFEKQYADKIFTIFQRLHERENYPGTGIGLAICKKIMEKHNGMITAESEIGKGATFHLYFPTVNPS